MPHEFSRRRHEFAGVLQRIRDSVYRQIAELDVTAWVTPEPVKFAKRTSGRRLTLKPGGKWGEGVFDCAWMHLDGVVPDIAVGARITLLIDVGGEACVVNDRGEPVQGLTNINSGFDDSLGRPGKRVVPLLARAKGGERVDLWLDAACNDLFGRMKDSGCLKEACIATQSPAFHQLQYDFEVLEELMRQLPESSAQHQQILKALCDVSDGLARYDEKEGRRAIALLTPLLALKGAGASLTLSAIGHSHMDLAWLWPVRETKRKCARTFATALRMMERYPDYVYGASQPQQYEWTKQQYPSLYRQICRRIREGRWDVQGGMWVEADTNITSGESLIRQFLFGKRFWRDEFGIEVTDLWLPDVFGYSGALPQIMAKCGVKYFMTQKLSWNQINSFPHQSFWWQGIDGTRVLAHMLPEEAYNSSAAPRAIVKAERNYRDSAVSSHALLLFGIGDGGGGPGEEHLERLAREKDLAGLVPVMQTKASDFFSRWEKQSKGFATWRGELYLEKHQGTLTTQARSKRFNRKMELALRDCEMLGALAMLVGQSYPQRQLAEIWKETLLYQFHDVLPGSSITRVYDESLERYGQMLAQVLELAATAERPLLEHIDTSAFSRPVAIFNSLSWQRTQWLNLSGKWIQVTVPPCGFAVIDEADAAASVMAGVKASTSELENDQLRVRFAADGSVTSVFDKVNSRESLAASGNRLAVWEDDGNAWDFAMHYRERQPAFMKLAASRAWVEGPVAVVEQTYEYNASSLTQQIRLEAGSRRLDFVTRVQWRESARMLRTSFVTTVDSDSVACEIQYGSIRRPTHRNTSWDHARIEISAHKWIDLSDNGYGVALLNDCKYGHYVAGNVLDLNLLRSTGSPDPVADRGPHEFTYSLCPHAGNHITGGVVRAGYELNVPLRATRTKPHAGGFAAPLSFISVDSPNVVVEVLKKAEDGEDLIVRLYECHGATTRCSVKLNLKHRAVSLVNMLEEGAKKIANTGGVVSLEFTPYAIHTLRLHV